MLYNGSVEEQTVLMDAVLEGDRQRTRNMKQRLLALAVAVLGIPFMLGWKRDS